MKKTSKFISLFSALMITCASVFVTPASAVYAATDTIKDELAATTSYYETYLASLTDFEVRAIEDVLLCLKGNGNLTNKDVFLNYMKSLINNGKFASKELPSANGGTYTVNYDIPEVYAMMLLIGQELELDVTDFYGCNLLENFVTSFNSLYDSYDLQNNQATIYYMKYVAAAINNYSDEITNSSELMGKVKDIILTHYYKSNETGTGIDYWGINADNNGAVLPSLYYLYKTDNDVKTKIDAAVAWTETLLEEQGYIVSWGVKSPNSTGLALCLFATFNGTKADITYSGLLTLKDTTTTGAYYSDYGLLSPTRDAYCGLLALSAAKEGKYFLDYEEENAVIEETTPGETTPEETTPDNSDQSDITTGDFNIPVIFMILAAASVLVISTCRKTPRNNN